MAIDFSKLEQAKKNTPESQGGAALLDKLHIRFNSRLTAKHRRYFTEQLALLLETGNTLHSSLQLLESHADHPDLKNLISDLYDNVSKGKTFSQALSQHKTLFSPTYITLVAAGEDGGYLAVVLQHLLEMEEKREELHSMVISAFFYPVILIIFSIVVVVFMLTSVFPKFTEMFASTGVKLPAVTQFLMTASELTVNYWWVVAGGIALIAGYFIMVIKQPDSKAGFDRRLLLTPLLGGLFVRIYLTHMMRLLNLSLQNGVTLLDALTICKDASSNIAFQQFVEKLVVNVREGKGLAVGFKNARFIPQLIRQMIQTGEETGKLPLVTGRLADYYQRELARRLALMAKIVEPAMLLAMGVFVSFIVSALILPIFKISSGIN